MMCEKYFEVLLNLCEQNSTNTNLNIEALTHGLISKLNTKKPNICFFSHPIDFSRALCSLDYRIRTAYTPHKNLQNTLKHFGF